MVILQMQKHLNGIYSSKIVNLPSLNRHFVHLPWRHSISVDCLCPMHQQSHWEKKPKTKHYLTVSLCFTYKRSHQDNLGWIWLEILSKLFIKEYLRYFLKIHVYKFRTKATILRTCILFKSNINLKNPI